MLSYSVRSFSVVNRHQNRHLEDLRPPDSRCSGAGSARPLRVDERTHAARLEGAAHLVERHFPLYLEWRGTCLSSVSAQTDGPVGELPNESHSDAMGEGHARPSPVGGTWPPTDP
jgi:hypothetical protein